MKAGGMEACLKRWSKTGMSVGNWVRRAVQLSISLEDGRGSPYTEGEEDGYRKQLNGGTVF